MRTGNRFGVAGVQAKVTWLRLRWTDPQADDPAIVAWPYPALLLATLFLNAAFWYGEGPSVSVSRTRRLVFRSSLRRTRFAGCGLLPGTSARGAVGEAFLVRLGRYIARIDHGDRPSGSLHCFSCVVD